MFYVDGPHPPGSIIVLSNELSRFADFTISLVRLQAPENTSLFYQKGVEICHSLNSAIRDMQGEWIWILGDDHTFDPQVLMRLLDTGMDIIAPACSARIFPFRPVLYSKNKDGEYVHGPWSTVPYGHLVKVAAAGTAGMLIRKRVLDAMADPWFEAGGLSKDFLSEDMYFCKKAIDAGFDVWVDTRQAIGHITPATIWPSVVDGQMCAMANFNGQDKFRVRLDTGFEEEHKIGYDPNLGTAPVSRPPDIPKNGG